MSYTIECYTLFDITQTGIVSRRKPEVDDDASEWLYKRNTQCNFDTILQAISLRSQPENVSIPKKREIIFSETDYFGYLFENDTTVPCWNFTFTIQHPSVFYDGITELGHLYTDCDHVPMIKTNTSWDKLQQFLESTDEMRNIYFKVVGYED